MHTNPYFKNNTLSGDMPRRASRIGNNKHPDLMKRQMGPAAITPAPSGLPGEVSFQTCDLSLPCPAGPPLAWVRTYRSMKPLQSGHGPGWDFSYNIWLEALPAGAGASAARLVIHDGGGRADTFQRQADGTYRCEGMFREGRFSGETFTLTFADNGTWTFNPLDSSPAAGKIAAITDRNGVALTCSYDAASGRLASVSDAFSPPRSLNVTWDGDGFITRVADSSGRSVHFTPYGAADPDGSAGDLKSASCPQVDGATPVCGATVYTYSTGNSDPNLNGNLLSVTDGAGRLLEAFAYAAETDPLHLDYDTCVSHNRNKTGHVTLNRREIRPPGTSPEGGYTIFEVDELGRLTETVCDRLHRVVSLREYTGFCTPGTPVTSTANRPTGPLRAGDPAYFETTCDYNADSLCTRITEPDGSQQLVTYDRDFRQSCPVRERGNPRLITLRSPGGEQRTVSCTYQPGFGNPEAAGPGNPLNGPSVKGGRNPGGKIQAQGKAGIIIGSTVGGITGGAVAGIVVAAVIAKIRNHGVVNGNIIVASANRKGWDGSVKGILKKEEGGRHTPFHNRSSIAGITAGAVAGIVVAACAAGEDEDCDGATDDDKRKIGPKQKAWLCSNFRRRMVSGHGQVSSWSYDEHGNCTSALSPLPNQGVHYQYNSRGQRTGSTVLNGPASSFHDEYAYDAATGFPGSVIRDSAGLHLATSVTRDPLGRVTAVTDPRGYDWHYDYNPLDQCVLIQSPAMPNRISMNFTIDAGGRVARCDIDHRAPDGSPDASNPAYSTFYVYDDRCRLIRIAEEDRPVDGSGVLVPDTLGIENFAVCDLSYDNAGQLVRVATPAACRAQATDLACDFTYDERGLLRRCIEGGTGGSNPVTTECDYDLLGACVRCATLADGGTSPETLFSYDGFHRLASTTDALGNVTTLEYDNQGFVTTSVYGQTNDVAGSKGNVLLKKSRSNLGHAQSNPMYDACAATVPRNVLKSFFHNGDIPTQADAALGGGAFFDVETEDATLTVERFTPGDQGSSASEVTVVDRSPAGLVQTITCNGDLLASFNYDSAGRVIRCQDGTCAADLVRDACGNITTQTRTDVSGVPGVPNKTFALTRVIDPLGRCTQTTDGSGNTAAFAYDSLDRCVTVTQPGGLVVHAAYDGDAATGPFSQQISADADGDGTAEVLSRVLVRCGECRSVTGSNGSSATLTRDALGRMIRCDYPDTTSQTVSFDSRGFEVQGIFQDGSTRDFTVDSLGRVTHVAWSHLPPAVVTVPDTTYRYDGLGRCVSAAQGSSQVTFGYDSCGNVTQETCDGLTVSCTFDQRGRSSLTYPDGRRLVESRNALGQLAAVAVVDAGTVVDPPVVTMAYLGHRVGRSIQGNGVVTSYSYRGDGDAPLAGSPDASFDDCVRVTVSNAAALVLSETRHRRDANQREIRCDTGFSAVTAAPGRSISMTRDRLGRVIDCVTQHREIAGGQVVSESNVSYTLDLAGRRLTTTGGANPGAYSQEGTLPPLGPGDQQMGQASTWPRGSLQWDDNGNLALMTTATGQLAFVHDAEGRLVAVNDPATGNPVISYDYDALGRVMIQRIHRGNNLPSIASRLVYDGSVCIQELSDDGSGVISPDMTFVCADGLQQCISTRNGTIYYPHGSGTGAKGLNHWGDRKDCVTLITNTAGEAVERFDSDDAGKPIFMTAGGLVTSDTNSSIGLRWLATGCFWEPAIGMFHGSGGTYSPELGQEVSQPRKKEYVGHVTLMK